MKLSIQVKTNAKKNEVTVREDGSLLVAVNVPPIEGKANKRVIDVLAQYLGRPKSTIIIVKGKKGKHKIVEIL
ncbi:MAG: DUF167 domain-containing protein [Ignavibacteriales bacterium]|nr:DUF167 domain-containing protein [Ignavibacteriales bacterium]